MIFLPRSRNVRKPTKRELSVSPLHNCTTLKGIQLCRPRCHLQVSLTVSRMMTPRCRKRWIVLKSAVFVRLALCALTRMVAMRLFLAIAATEPASWQVWRICQSLSGI
jgi:hypothetical protein